MTFHLTTVTPPKKETATKIVRKCVKQARYNKDNVLLPPVFEEEEVEYEIWIVETSYNGKTEKHKFMSEEDAKSYYGSFN